jgi:hypothetical protein
MNQVAIALRLDNGGIELLRGIVYDPEDGQVRSLFVFGSVGAAEQYVADTGGLSLSEGWRGVMVPTTELPAICDDLDESAD